MNRHASIDELLAVRDGDATVWAKAHAESCTTCRDELYGLEQMRSRLKALPASHPPRDRWALVAAQAKQERNARRLHSVMGLAAAAMLAAVTFVAVHPKPAPVVDTAALNKAMLQSQAMEATYKSLKPDQRVMNAQAASVAADLEANLQRVDSQLNVPQSWNGKSDRVVGLWRERTGILSALVDVHQGHATYASF